MKPFIIGIIPARYASQRLPAKPLVDIAGLPMVVKVAKNCSTSKYIDKIIVATDSQKIIDICSQHNVDSILTNAEIPTGTDRVFAAFNKYIDTNSIENYDNAIVVNIQGDEPLLTGMDIDIMLEKFINSESDVGTLITKITDPADLQNKGCIKVVLDENQNALYFSRSPIPFNRDTPINEWLQHYIYWKHIGIYAYKLETLKQFVLLPISTLETTEKLEQLRLLERGTKFLCFETKSKLIGVDTQEDLEKVRAELLK